MQIERIEDMVAWQLAKRLEKRVLAFTERPRVARDVDFCRQIRKSASSAPANMATSYELNVIAAAVIGGANLAGGVGGPLGAIVGCVLLEVIRNGLVLAQVSSYWQQTLVGVIIILAVLVDRIRSRLI